MSQPMTAGQKVIIVWSEARREPLVTEIKRVLVHNFEVLIDGGTTVFSRRDKRESYHRFMAEETVSGQPEIAYRYSLANEIRWSRNWTQCWLYTDTVHKYLTEQHAKILSCKEAERAQRQADAEKKEQERLALVEEVKVLCGGEAGLVTRCRLKDVLPNGDRFIVLDLPVHPDRVTRIGFNRLMLRLRTKSPSEFDLLHSEKVEQPQIEAEYSLITAASSGASMGRRGDYWTDHDAIWDSVQAAYNAW